MKKRAFAAACAAMSLALTLTSCGGRGGRPAATNPEGMPSATTSEKMFPVTTEAPEPVNEINPEDFGCVKVEGGISVCEYYGPLEDVVIPSELYGLPVVCIGLYKENKRGDWGNMKSVVIPEGVTTLSPTAFYDCESLENITMPSTLVNFDIGYYNSIPTNTSFTPFEGTAWLEKKREEDPLVIVNNVVVDGKTCTRRVEIPEGVTHIAPDAFRDCTTVTSFTLPESLESIGEHAFDGCSRLEKIVIPENVSAIGDYAFYDCGALADVTLPEHAMDIGYRVFYKKNEYSDYSSPIPWLENKLEEDPIVIVGSNLIRVGEYYGNDDDLEYMVVPDSIQSIAGGAFEDCQLKDVKLPDGIKKLSNNIFDGCDLESITIPDSVTEIGERAFANCNHMESITIPDGVTEIGAEAFVACNLQNITIPESVTKIGKEAFYYCHIIEGVTLPDGIKFLGEDAFAHSGCDIYYKGEIYYPELYNELYEAINGSEES